MCPISFACWHELFLALSMKYIDTNTEGKTIYGLGKAVLVNDPVRDSKGKLQLQLSLSPEANTALGQCLQGYGCHDLTDGNGGVLELISSDNSLSLREGDTVDVKVSLVFEAKLSTVWIVLEDVRPVVL